jgi:hypothetical protein
MRSDDWIYSCSKGIWQVSRLLRGFNEFQYDLNAPPVKSRKVFVFSKRLANSAWKRSFDTEVCEASLTKPLSAADAKRVKELFAANPGLKAAFDAYDPKPISLNMNLAMHLPNRTRLEGLCTSQLRPALASGLALPRILDLLESAGLFAAIGKFPINTTLQLVCENHELRDGDFVFRTCRILPF